MSGAGGHVSFAHKDSLKHATIPKGWQITLRSKERFKKCYEVMFAEVCTCTMIMMWEFKYVLSFFFAKWQQYVQQSQQGCFSPPLLPVVTHRSPQCLQKGKHEEK